MSKLGLQTAQTKGAWSLFTVNSTGMPFVCTETVPGQHTWTLRLKLQKPGQPGGLVWRSELIHRHWLAKACWSVRGLALLYPSGPMAQNCAYSFEETVGGKHKQSLQTENRKNSTTVSGPHLWHSHHRLFSTTQHFVPAPPGWGVGKRAISKEWGVWGGVGGLHDVW